MKKKIIVTAAFLGCFAVLFAMTVGISGTWVGQLSRPDGSASPVHYVFKADNKSLTGTSTGTHGAYDLSEGMIKGDSLWFSIVVDNGQKIENAGKYYTDGDSIGLDLVFMGVTMHTTLKRETVKK